MKLQVSLLNHGIQRLLDNGNRLCDRDILHLATCNVEMSAATQFFHDDLYIDFIDRSCTDKNLILVFGADETCLDSPNIE